MILRKPAGESGASANEDYPSLADVTGVDRGWAADTPLRWRLSLVSGFAVIVSVAVITLAAYITVSTSMLALVDRDLERTAESVMSRTLATDDDEKIEDDVRRYKAVAPRMRISITPAGSATSFGDPIVSRGEFSPAGAGLEVAMSTIGSERVMVLRDSSGTTVTLARDLRPTQSMVSSLGSVLVIILAAGTVVAILAGLFVASTALRPIQRLKSAVDYVTFTDELHPIAVVGNDELAQLTESFNRMLGALKESRVRQAQFVADAGHELKTPLTSMRTNIELLMMLNRTDSAHSLSDADRQEIEDDVIAQMSELSTLIGDLVDLAREDASDPKAESVDLEEVIDVSLERARRRRPDVDFRIQTVPWVLQGDHFSLGRAILNVLDNAAKWSPPTGVVRVRMQQVGPNVVRLRVDDSGPGIPVEERERVFERFYRSAEARSMPGSGLGLAIVKQVIERHGGTIEIKEPRDGGTRMEILLPGSPGDDPGFEDPQPDGLQPDGLQPDDLQSDGLQPDGLDPSARGMLDGPANEAPARDHSPVRDDSPARDHSPARGDGGHIAPFDFQNDGGEDRRRIFAQRWFNQS